MTTSSATMILTQSKQHVAIIGCGASGLVTLKELMAEGHTGIIFERASSAGGIFNTVYQEGQMVSSTVITMFSDFFGSEGDHALTHPRMFTFVEYSKYLKEYAAHFNLLPHIRYEHEVVRVERCSADKKKWRLQIRQTTKDAEWHEELFDRVAICAGTHQARAMPALVGIENFKGKIKHMQDVKTFDEFSGKRVCVVGSGEAASDMALAASKHGEKAFVSIRRDHGYLVSRYPFGFSNPSDLQTTRVRYSIPAIFGVLQSVLWLCLGKLFPFLFGSKTARPYKIERQMLAMNAKQVCTGNFRNTYGTKSSGLAEAIVYYGCSLKPDIQSLRENSILFADGTEERIDEIVCCTGFENRFPFLDCNDDDLTLQQVGHDARIPHNLYKHSIHPLTGSSLAFIGFVRPCFGAIPPLAEMQARWFALLCSNKMQLPNSSVMVDQIHTYVRYIEYLLTSYRTDRIASLTDFVSFSDDMAQAIGCRPSFGLKMLLTDPRLWIRCMLGPISNAQYRLCGPHAQPEQARRIILTLKWNPMFYNVLELALLYMSAFLWFCGIRKCKPHAWYPIHEWSI